MGRSSIGAHLIVLGVFLISPDGLTQESRALSQDTLQDQALQRLGAFISAFRYKPDTVELVVEETLSVRFSMGAVAHQLNQEMSATNRPVPSDAELTAARARFIAQHANPNTRRFMLFTDFEKSYRMEEIGSLLPSPWSDQTDAAASHRMVIQGAEGRWRVGVTRAQADFTSGYHPPDGYVGGARGESWGTTCDRFLNLGGSILRFLEEIRGLENPVSDGEEVSARAIMPDDSAREIEIGFREESPANLSPLDWIFITGSGINKAGLYEFSEWSEVGQTVRPTVIHYRVWDLQPPVAEPATRASVVAQQPTNSSHVKALHIRFDEPLDEALFTYVPPEDFLVLENQRDGSQLVYGPGSEQMLEVNEALEQARRRGPVVSARQQRIQDRIARAASPSRLAVAVGVGGVLLLLGSGGFLMWRRMRSDR